MTTLQRVLQARSWRYAALEVGIVAVGILLALAANNWHEARQDRERERIYLQSFVTDLTADTVDLIQKIGYANERVEYGRTLLEVVNGSVSLSPLALAQAIELAPSQTDPIIAPYTLDDLKSTGNVRLIRNRALMREIFSYYRQVESSLQYQQLYRETTWNGFGRFRDRLLPPDLRVSLYASQPEEAANALDQAKILRDLRSIPQVEELLRAAVETNLEEVDAWGGWLEQATDLLAKLRLELGEAPQGPES